MIIIIFRVTRTSEQMPSKTFRNMKTRERRRRREPRARWEREAGRFP